MLIDNESIFKFNSKLKSITTLKKTSGEVIGILNDTKSLSLSTNLIGVNSIDFLYPADREYADKVKIGKLINLKILQEQKVDDGNGGFYNPQLYEEEFYITDIDKEDSVKKGIKVTAKSNYILLAEKIVNGYSGIKKLYRTDLELSSFTPGDIDSGVQYETYLDYENSGLINYVMKQIPDWDINSISNLVADKYVEVDFNEESVLDIFTSFIPENYEGIVQFDTINKEIGIVGIEELGENEGLIIENTQIAKKISTKTNSKDWVTKLYVYGNDNISIAPINPTGDDFLLNLSYLKNEEYMSSELINAIDNYEQYVENNRANFELMLSDLSTLQEELITLLDDRDNLQYEIQDLRDELNEVIIRYSNSNEIPPRTTEQIVLDINEKERLIGNSFTETKDIGSTTNESVTLSESYIGDLQVYLLDNNYAILGELGVNYNFTDPIVSGLDGTVAQKVVLVYDADFGVQTLEQQIESKESAINTKENDIYELRNNLKAVNYFEEQGVSNLFTNLQPFIREKFYRNENITDRQDLYDKGKKVLDKINSPHITISVDSVDFFNSLKYKSQWEKINLGSELTVISDIIPGGNVNMKLIGYKWDLDNNGLSLTLSSSNDGKDGAFELEDLLKRANKTSTKISINSSEYGKYVESGERNTLLNYINNALDLGAQQARIQDKNQDISFDDGITLSSKVDDGRKIKLLNNLIAVTTDGFKTTEVAISPDGVIAEKLIGKVILGTQLEIQSSSNQSFRVTKDGIQINGSDLIITESLPNAFDGMVEDIGTLEIASSDLRNEIDSITKDLLVTKIESESLLRDYTKYENESNDIIIRAQNLGISTQAYEDSLTSLKSTLDSYVLNKIYPVALIQSEVDTIQNKFEIVERSKTNILGTIDEEFTNQKSILKDNIYNGITIGTTNGFVAELSDETVRTTLNASSGLLIEGKDDTNSAYEDRFFADNQGNLVLAGSLTTQGGNSRVILSGDNGIKIQKYVTSWSDVLSADVNGNLTVKGTINADELIIDGTDVLSSFGKLSQLNKDLGDITAGSLNINDNFIVDSLGKMTATGGEFSGDIKSANIDISEDIKVGNNIELGTLTNTTVQKTIYFHNDTSGTNWIGSRYGNFWFIGEENVQVVSTNSYVTLEGVTAAVVRATGTGANVIIDSSDDGGQVLIDGNRALTTADTITAVFG